MVYWKIRLYRTLSPSGKLCTIAKVVCTLLSIYKKSDKMPTSSMAVFNRFPKKSFPTFPIKAVLCPLVRNENGKIKLRIILDNFSVEVFVNDGELFL